MADSRERDADYEALLEAYRAEFKPRSRTVQKGIDPRNYALLGELNTRPRTTYLAAVRNVNPELGE